MNAARRLPPRPRSRPHRFHRDWTVAPDPFGRLTCWCGSLERASVHRLPPLINLIDVARLAAGDREPEEADSVDDSR